MKSILKLSTIAMLFTAVGNAEEGLAEEPLSFYLRTTQDLLSISHGGVIPLGNYPEGIPTLAKTGIPDMLAFTATLRDANGQHIGVASELEDFPNHTPNYKGPYIWDTLWTLMIHNRGSLYLVQQEKMAEEDIAMFLRVKETGETWEGETPPHSTTYGPLPEGYGIIVGGSGEFEGATGKFQEIATLYSFTPEGVLDAKLELRLWLDEKE